jgi:copper chaperone NosL
LVSWVEQLCGGVTGVPPIGSQWGSVFESSPGDGEFVEFLDSCFCLDDDHRMFRLQPRPLVLIVVYLVVIATVAAAEGPPPPGPKDRCAVCGMFVAQHPNWIAAIIEADGSRHYFDGPKDLFRFLLREGGSVTENSEIWVTDYYTTKPLRARDAVFVRGSDVLGPMGAELVPLASAELAESFRTDHGGDDPLAFGEIDDAVLRSLE